MLKIATEDEKTIDVQLNFDKNGNLYIELPGQPETKTIFQINIDRTNRPYCDKANYDIIENPKIKCGKLVTGRDKLLLKQKAALKIKEELEIENQVDLEDNMESMVNYENENIYFQEDNDYYEDNLSHESDGENEYFDFYGSDIPINERNNGDIIALYETLLYTNGGMIYFKTKLNNGIPLYRILMFPNGKCKFRVIGEINNKNYYLKLDKDENLLFISE